MQDLHESRSEEELGPNVRRFSARRVFARGRERARALTRGLSATAGTLVDTEDKKAAAAAAVGLVFLVGFLSGLLAAKVRD